MNRLSFVLMAAAFATYGQKIETQKTDRTRIMRIETALNHLTVIELGDPVEQVAAGNASYKVEWRGNKVFVERFHDGGVSSPPDLSTSIACFALFSHWVNKRDTTGYPLGFPNWPLIVQPLAF